jgi:diguanylate cyclase (GGDEF)-like protein
VETSTLALGGASALLVALCVLLIRLWRAAEARSRSLIDQIPQTAVLVFDPGERLRFAAGAALRDLGWDRAAIEGARLGDLLPAAQAAELSAHVSATLRGETRSMPFRLVPAGRDYWLRIVPLADPGDAIRGALVMALDVTHRDALGMEFGGDEHSVDAVAEVTRELARSADPVTARAVVCEGARLVAEAPVAALFEPDATGVELVPTAAAGARLGNLALPLSSEAAGSARAFVRADEVLVDHKTASAVDLEFLYAARAESVLWIPIVRDRGAIGLLALAWHQRTSAVSLRASALLNILAAQAALAIGRAEMLGRLEALARTDDLTGLPNRRSWQEHLPRELARAERDQQPLCVAMLDLDNFKDYNDRRGHQAGDRLLKEAAAAWRNRLRTYDVLARYGGEEFSVILPGCTTERAVRLVERLREATPEGETCSAGIAEWGAEEAAEALVGRADAALYRAKRAGRDQTVVAPGTRALGADGEEAPGRHERGTDR